MAEPAIETRGLSKAYRTGLTGAVYRALHPVDITVARGECVAVLGHNGAGKTTFVHLLAGLLRPTSGTALLLGLSADSAEARRALGFLPDRPAFPARLRALELLEYCGQLHGMRAADARKRGIDLLERFGIVQQANRPIAQLSAGTRQRLGLAQALVHHPEVVLLDEPLTGLDASSRRVVLGALRELRSAGTTLLVATHHFAEWAAVSDRVALLQRGRLQVIGTTAEVLARLPAQVLYTLPPGAATRTATAPGRPLAAPTGLHARLVSADERDALLREVAAAGGTVLRIEPQASHLVEPELRS